MNDSPRFAGKPWWQMPMTPSRLHVVRRPPEKGEFGGTCQRIACDKSEAHWFNATNGKYYCGACAKTFNDVCRRNGQAPLCEPHAPAAANSGPIAAESPAQATSS